MDAEALASCQSYEELKSVRDDLLAMIVEESAVCREEIAALAAGNRRDRRKAKAYQADLDTLDRRARREIEALFEKFVRGFDPETGTGKAVQEEASAKLATLFS